MTERFEKTFSIGDASRITGVSQRQLRAWEGKHIPQPERLICGERTYRRYTQAQINLIARIKEYQAQGFTLSAAAKKAKDDLARKGVRVMRKKPSKMKTRMCPFLDENCVKGSDEFKINREQAELISSLESNSFALGRFKSSLLLPGTRRMLSSLESSSL